MHGIAPMQKQLVEVTGSSCSRRHKDHGVGQEQLEIQGLEPGRADWLGAVGAHNPPVFQVSQYPKCPCSHGWSLHMDAFTAEGSRVM